MATFGLSESTEVVNLRRISIDKLLYISATLSNPRYQPAVQLYFWKLTALPKRFNVWTLLREYLKISTMKFHQQEELLKG